MALLPPLPVTVRSPFPKPGRSWLDVVVPSRAYPFGDFGVLCGPQHPENAGLHTWLVRAVFHTRHSTTDPVPFVAQFDRRQQVNCR